MKIWSDYINIIILLILNKQFKSFTTFVHFIITVLLFLKHKWSQSNKHSENQEKLMKSLKHLWLKNNKEINPCNKPWIKSKRHNKPLLKPNPPSHPLTKSMTPFKKDSLKLSILHSMVFKKVCCLMLLIRIGNLTKLMKKCLFKIFKSQNKLSF